MKIDWYYFAAAGFLVIVFIVLKPGLGSTLPSIDWDNVTTNGYAALLNIFKQ